MIGFTYNDTFVEEVVARQDIPSWKPIRLGTYVVTFLLGVIFVITLPAVTQTPQVVFAVLLLFLGFGLLSYHYSYYLQVEFEYAMTNKDLDFFVIYAQKKRKNLLSFQVEDIVVCAPSMTKWVRPYAGSGIKTFDCTSHREGTPFYTLIYFDRKKGENRRVFFEPKEALLSALKRQAPQKIFITENDE